MPCRASRIYASGRHHDCASYFHHDHSAYLDDYSAAAADPYASASNLEYYRWRVENLIENVEVVRGMYDLYGTMVF